MSTKDAPHSSTSQSLWMGKSEELNRLSFFQSRPDFIVFGLAWNLTGPQWGQVNPSRKYYNMEPNYCLDDFFALRRIITLVDLNVLKDKKIYDFLLYYERMSS